MVKEEIWSVPLHRAVDFFRELCDVTEDGVNVYAYRSCRITLTEMKPTGTEIWAVKRIQLRMEGEDADVEAIYHRYFLRFLSAGG